MASIKTWKQFWIIVCSYLMVSSTFAETIVNPCVGPTALLNIINRPSNADSVCVVPAKQIELEAGYQYQQRLYTSNYLQNYPQASLRLGLPASNELVILLPLYVHETITPRAGFTTSAIGIKHQFNYSSSLQMAIEPYIILPSGSIAFGSNATGFTLNGIINYIINPTFNLTFMLGASSLTAPTYFGGQRYNTINPDLILTASLTDKLDFYTEVFGQTRTGPGLGSGFNADAGFVYLVIPQLSVDIEAGQRISGDLIGFKHYVGAGLAVLFG